MGATVCWDLLKVWPSVYLQGILHLHKYPFIRVSHKFQVSSFKSGLRFSAVQGFNDSSLFTFCLWLPSKFIAFYQLLTVKYPSEIQWNTPKTSVKINILKDHLFTLFSLTWLSIGLFLIRFDLVVGLASSLTIFFLPLPTSSLSANQFTILFAPLPKYSKAYC